MEKTQRAENIDNILEYNGLNNYKSNRIKSIDIAKAIGILLIVLGHTLEFGELRKFIYSFHVPLFFFLSGICFTVKNNKKFIKRKLESIYFPYIVMSIVSIIIYSIMGKYIGADNLNLINNFVGMLYANPNLGNMQWNQPLWFLPCLLIQLILINIFENFIKNKKSKQKIRVVMVIVVSILGYALSNLKIFLPLQLEAAMCMTIFTYLGIIIKENKEILKKSKTYENIMNKKYIMVLFFCITVLISIVLVYHNETISVMQDKYGNYAIYFVCSIFMIIDTMLISIFINKAMPRQKLISYVGQSTLMILLLHKFPILFFQKICPFIKDVLNQSDTLLNNIIGIVISIVVVTMCMICKSIIDTIVRRKQYDRN